MITEKTIKNMTDEELRKQYKELKETHDRLKQLTDEYQKVEYQLSKIQNEIDFRCAKNNICDNYFVNNKGNRYMYVAEVHHVDKFPCCLCFIIEHGVDICDNVMYWDMIYIIEEYQKTTQEQFMAQMNKIVGLFLAYNSATRYKIKEEFDV